MVSPFNLFVIKFLCGGKKKFVTLTCIVENLNKQEGKLELGVSGFPHLTIQCFYYRVCEAVSLDSKPEW